MKELRISSLPLLQLTLHAYEASLFSLKASLPFERDHLRRLSIKSECESLEKMIAHTSNVIANVQA